MHLQALLATLVSLAVITTSTPTPKFKLPAPLDLVPTVHKPNSNALEKRTLGGVRLSDGANFTDHVWYGVYPLNDCIDLGD